MLLGSKYCVLTKGPQRSEKNRYKSLFTRIFGSPRSVGSQDWMIGGPPILRLLTKFCSFSLKIDIFVWLLLFLSSNPALWTSKMTITWDHQKLSKAYKIVGFGDTRYLRSQYLKFWLSKGLSVDIFEERKSIYCWIYIMITIFLTFCYLYHERQGNLDFAIFSLSANVSGIFVKVVSG